LDTFEVEGEEERGREGYFESGVKVKGRKERERKGRRERSASVQMLTVSVDSLVEPIGLLRSGLLPLTLSPLPLFSPSPTPALALSTFDRTTRRTAAE